MTIDETIKYEKMCSERRDAFVDRTTEEHKQLAEWLEELKALKSDSIPIIHGKAELELHDKEIRAKAIDEFVANAERWNNNIKSIRNEEAFFTIEDIRKVAEQMKAGK